MLPSSSAAAERSIGCSRHYPFVRGAMASIFTSAYLAGAQSMVERPGRMLVEKLGVNPVHDGEVAHVLQKHGGLQQAGERRATGCKHGEGFAGDCRVCCSMPLGCFPIQDRSAIASKRIRIVPCGLPASEIRGRRGLLGAKDGLSGHDITCLMSEIRLARKECVGVRVCLSGHADIQGCGAVSSAIVLPAFCRGYAVSYRCRARRRRRSRRLPVSMIGASCTLIRG